MTRVRNLCGHHAECACAAVAFLSQGLTPAQRAELALDLGHYMQLSEASYGWRGALALGMLGGADSAASNLSGVLGSVLTGDKAVFAHRAGTTVECVLYRAVESEVQEPHNWLVVDHERKELVLGKWRLSTVTHARCTAFFPTQCCEELWM